jgi:ABC-type branched-subunit amino acid transport system permease subunit
MALCPFQRTLSASAFGTEANIDYLLMAIVGGVGGCSALLGAGIVIVLKTSFRTCSAG